MTPGSGTLTYWLEMMRIDGCRLTKARRTIIEMVISNRYASTPQQLYDASRRIYPGIGLVTVYRTLEKLEQLGLVRRVHQGSGCNGFLLNEQGHNHLIICENCGRAEYFEGDDLQPLFEKVNQAHGFLVNQHWLQLSGLCSDCQKNISQDSLGQDNN
jgi:Fur family transcriptional regulator, ferric uptake regulator